MSKPELIKTFPPVELEKKLAQEERLRMEGEERLLARQQEERLRMEGEQRLLARQQEEMASRASMEVKNPALNTNIDNPPTSLPQSEGGLMESYGTYSRGVLPFIGLSLAGGVVSALGKDAVDYFLRKDNSFEKGYKYEPVIVNQIGLDVENTQRMTTSRAQQRKKRH